MDWQAIKHIKLDTWIVTTLVVLFVVAVFAVVWNKGFYFAEYNYSYLVQAADEASLEKLLGLPGISGVSRSESVVRFQQIQRGELDTAFEQQGIAAVVIESGQVLPNNLALWLLNSAVVAVAATILYAYFFLYRKVSGGGRRRIIQADSLYFAAFLLVAFTNFGLLSLLSRIYELRIETMATWLLASCWALVVSYVAVGLLIDTNNRVAEDLPEMLSSSRLSVARITRFSWRVVLVVLLFVGIGLGQRVLVELLALFVQISLFAVGLEVLPMQLYRLTQYSFAKDSAEYPAVEEIKTVSTPRKSKLPNKGRRKKQRRR